MIIDKILAQGEYTLGDVNNANYECYRFKIDREYGNIIFELQPAAEKYFPGTTEKEKENNQQAKRAVMMKKLTDDLNLFLNIPPTSNPQQYYEIQRERKLVLKTESFGHIAKYINTNHKDTELLRIGMNIINIFTALYFIEGQRRPAVKSIFEGKLGGLVVYRKDDSSEAIRFRKPHQFYIGKKIPDEPNASVRADISDHLGQELRDAFKHGIAAILNKRSEEVFVDTHYNELNALSFNLSDDDFNALKSAIGVSNVISVSQASGQPNELVLERAVGSSEASVELIPAVNDLNETVFNPHRAPLPTHREKLNLINTVRDKFLAVNEIKTLSAMYKHINLPVNKVILNIHDHPIYDTIFIKTNTNSWQHLIEKIRHHALQVLISSLGINVFASDDENAVITDAVKNKTINYSDPQAVKRTLELYLIDPLFCEHRSNNHIGNFFHSTKAVKVLRAVIDACDAQIKRDHAADALQHKMQL